MILQDFLALSDEYFDTLDQSLYDDKKELLHYFYRLQTEFQLLYEAFPYASINTVLFCLVNIDSILSKQDYFDSLDDRKEKFLSLFSVKNAEYVSKYSTEKITDVLYNFKSASKYRTLIDPIECLLGYVLKHFLSLFQILDYIIEMKMFQNGTYQDFYDKNKNTIEEKIGDIFIYMLLLNGLLNEPE